MRKWFGGGLGEVSPWFVPTLGIIKPTPIGGTDSLRFLSDMMSPPSQAPFALFRTTA